MRTLCAVVVMSLALGAGIANAAGTPPAKAGSEDAAQAKEHYKRGTKLYDLGKYDEAIKAFEAAFEIKDEPVLLYNIAQAHRLANRYPDALRFYRTYLRRSPKALNKSEVEQKIADMENLITQQNKIATAQPSDAIPPGQRPTSGNSTTSTTSTPPPVRTAPVTAPEPAPEVSAPEPTTPEPATVASNDRPATSGHTEEPETAAPPTGRPVAQPKAAKAERSAKPGNGKLIGGIVVVAAGVGAVVGGVIMGLGASSAASQQSAAPVFNPALDAAGKSNQLLGFVLDGAGGALVIVGAVIAGLGASQNQRAAAAQREKTDDRPAVTFLPSVSRDYAGAALHISF